MKSPIMEISQSVKIVESGGLKSLRKKIINENGKMEVISRPEYKLIITIPKKEDELHD